MKKVVAIAFIVFLVFTALVILATCSCPETYYNEEDKYDWIKFGRGEWEDSEGNKGVYDRNGSSFTFYKDDVEFFSGTLKDGTFSQKIAGFVVGVYRTRKAQSALEKEKKGA